MRIMFPTVVILGIAGIFMGILNSYNHFTMPALAPIVWNVVIIGVVVAFSRAVRRSRRWPGACCWVRSRNCSSRCRPCGSGGGDAAA